MGAVVAYKAIFETRNVFVKALDGCYKDDILTELLDEEEKDGWGTNTDQEKLNIFYQHIIKCAIPTLKNRVIVTEQIQSARSTHPGDQQGTPEHTTSEEQDTSENRHDSVERQETPEEQNTTEIQQSTGQEIDPGPSSAAGIDFKL